MRRSTVAIPLRYWYLVWRPARSHHLVITITRSFYKQMRREKRKTILFFLVFLILIIFAESRFVSCCIRCEFVSWPHRSCSLPFCFAVVNIVNIVILWMMRPNTFVLLNFVIRLCFSCHFHCCIRSDNSFHYPAYSFLDCWCIRDK